MRLGSPPIRYELACRFRIDTTDHLKYTLIVYTSDIQNPTSINFIRHRGDTSTIAKCSSTAVSSTSSSCSPTMFRSYLAPKTRNESPRSSTTRTLPRPSLYGYDVASQRGRTADEDDIDKFQAITASGGMNRSRGGGG
ncbi:hypothetical protein ARMGADRAFT_447894 [Armillaria gallica]|uniref:Uncharacterized protein n=1 Tax=Armillaria gallica TaxID=47427 RepID=A0A2H3DH89_ARMGA|nr:hypothetical protein ARMGADRAFT_447894 [Armillaria gallica]